MICQANFTWKSLPRSKVTDEGHTRIFKWIGASASGQMTLSSNTYIRYAVTSLAELDFRAPFWHNNGFNQVKQVLKGLELSKLIKQSSCLTIFSTLPVYSNMGAEPRKPPPTHSSFRDELSGYIFTKWIIICNFPVTFLSVWIFLHREPSSLMSGDIVTCSQINGCKQIIEGNRL